MQLQTVTLGANRRTNFKQMGRNGSANVNDVVMFELFPQESWIRNSCAKNGTMNLCSHYVNENLEIKQFFQLGAHLIRVLKEHRRGDISPYFPERRAWVQVFCLF